MTEDKIRAELAKVVRNDNHDGRGFFRYANYQTPASDELVRRGWARESRHRVANISMVGVSATALGRCIAVLHEAWA